FLCFLPCLSFFRFLSFESLSRRPCPSSSARCCSAGGAYTASAWPAYENPTDAHAGRCSSAAPQAAHREHERIVLAAAGTHRGGGLLTLLRLRLRVLPDAAGRGEERHDAALSWPARCKEAGVI